MASPIQAPKLPPIYREAREGDRASVLERSHMDIGSRDEGQATTLIETEETSTHIQRYIFDDKYNMGNYRSIIKNVRYTEIGQSLFPRLRDSPPVPRGNSRNLGKRL